jgi:peptidoglycan lytic transglycosylase
MRFILPAALAGALFAASVPASARTPEHQRRERLRSHISLHVSSHDVAGGRRVLLRGRVRPRGSHRVKLVFRGTRGATLGTASNRNGAFSVRWRPHGTGIFRVRAYGLHDRRVRASVSPARRVTAYRTAEASYYGPGLYGGALACGGTLQPGTLGVAHKTLPCGSRVRLRYRGHSVTVPVVDRGPYVAGRDFDLTEATRARLHFPSTGVLLSSR